MDAIEVFEDTEFRETRGDEGGRGRGRVAVSKEAPPEDQGPANTEGKRNERQGNVYLK